MNGLRLFAAYSPATALCGSLATAAPHKKNAGKRPVKQIVNLTDPEMNAKIGEYALVMEASDFGVNGNACSGFATSKSRLSNHE